MRFRWIALAFLLSLIVGSLIWLAAPLVVDDPAVALATHTPARQFFDGQGRLIHAERTYDAQWRFDIPLSQISFPAVATMVAAEDANFFQHNGIDYRAILRAFWMNLTFGRIVSGASTISMQVARLAAPQRRRSYWSKFLQASQARKLERRHSKEEILALYFNHLPFGGKIYGIEAASLYYFGKHANALTWAEASLLCGLPQRPNAYRPDLHLDKARQRQRVVLALMARHGLLSPGLAWHTYHIPLPLRNFSLPAEFMTREDTALAHYLRLAKTQVKNAFQIHIPLNWDVQQAIEQCLIQRRNALAGVRDGAAVLLDSRNGHVLALVGTLDYHSPLAGQVNACTAVRSAGSTLKPFIYAEAIDGGLICPETLLWDAPLRYATYTPTNYDGQFKGKVTAAEALSLSLNTPAIRLLAQLGPKRLEDRFASLHILATPRSRHADGKTDITPHGLSLALGTAGHTLLNLTAAYAMFARNGNYLPCSFLEDVSIFPSPPTAFPPTVCVLINQMLTQRALPACVLPVAWKTGTSNGNRDAWCFAYTPDFTLGVWFGNKSGSPSAELTGLHAAAPCAGAIMSMLYDNHAPPHWPSPAQNCQPATLCTETGLTAGAHCLRTFTAYAGKDIPLRLCTQCGHPVPSRPAILSPVPGHFIADVNGNVQLMLRATPSNVLWFIDNRYLGPLPDNSPRVFAVGNHSLTVVSPQDPPQTATVHFTVKTHN